MGSKFKNRQKNAFSFFLDDYVSEQRHKGRQISYKLAAEECGPLWKQLTEKEKNHYSTIASAHKEYSRNDKRGKFTSTGISFAQLEKEQEMLREKVAQADKEIKSTISNLDFDLTRTHLFYIIHCNYYCKTDTGYFVPAEIAIVEFNLEDGIRRVYHTLINPGPIPMGYAYEAKQICDEVHGLPIPPYDEGDSDYCGILDKILSFLQPGMLPDGRYPPLYCLDKNLKASENILQVLSDNRADGKNHFRVYQLYKMFFWLKNKCTEFAEEEDLGFPVISNAISEIEKDIFCYVPGISCDFHLSSEDKYQNCSLSVVQRYVYVICDHCCQYVKVDLIPGCHCRKKCDTNRTQTKVVIEQQSWERDHSDQPPDEVSEFDFDGSSSYCRDSNLPDFKSEAGYFLHDELESKFSTVDMRSLRSEPCRRDPRPGFNFHKKKDRIVELLDDDTDEDDDEIFNSLGRGISHFKK